MAQTPRAGRQAKGAGEERPGAHEGRGEILNPNQRTAVVQYKSSKGKLLSCSLPTRIKSDVSLRGNNSSTPFIIKRRIS